MTCDHQLSREELRVSDREELRALAERVEALGGPCRETDALIWRALECTECVGTGCSQTEAPCSACGGSGNVPGSEWRDTPQAAMADHLAATRLEALQAQPVREDIRQVIADAYIKGAEDVHSFLVDNPGEAPRGDGDYAESGYDYADAALDKFSSAAHGPALSALTASPPVVVREAVNRILAELLAPLMSDVGERIEVGNRVSSLILAALSTPVAQGDEVREALEPFVAALDEWGDDESHQDRRSLWDHPLAMNITLGDFRRAKAALDRLQSLSGEQIAENANCSGDIDRSGLAQEVGS